MMRTERFRLIQAPLMCFMALSIAIILPNIALAVDLVLTEIMYDPASSEDDWEWVEIFNTGPAAVNLGGYVFDDDDGSALGSANLAGGSVGSGHAAVLFNADEKTAADYAAAWGAGINLIPVTSWPGFGNSGDRVGLWDSFANYNSGDFSNAVIDVLYSDAAPWPNNNGASSIALNDVSLDPNEGNSWSLSQTGDSLGSYQSTATLSPGAQINNTDDIGNPGVIPAGFPTGSGNLVITEAMNNPASAEDNWEWIEIFNDTGAPLDLTGYVVDDNNSLAVSAANIEGVVVPAGGLAVLYNADDLTAMNFADAWGAGLTLVGVTEWNDLALNNTGDTIGIWDSFADYTGDNQTHNNVIASFVIPGNLDDGMGSIYSTNGIDMELSEFGDGISFNANTATETIVNNSGDDVGSPGIGAPGFVAAAVVPEPSTFVLLAGLIGLTRFGRPRRRVQN